MRLQDGQVMDFVKSVGPYVDERMEAVRLPANAATAEASIQETLLASVGTVGELPLPTPLNAAPATEAVTQAVSTQAVSTWSAQPVQLPSQYFTCPPLNAAPPSKYFSCPSLYVTSPSPDDALQEFTLPNNTAAFKVKIQARIDALASLEDPTLEVSSTIKTLQWVLKEIS